MKAKDIIRLGIPPGACIDEVQRLFKHATGDDIDHRDLRQDVERLASNPEAFLDDPRLGGLAKLVLETGKARQSFVKRESNAPYRQYGQGLEPTAVMQMEHACALPIAVQGALMPDAHQGYGLPIGGVLATKNAVIPYAVGVDIACRMRLSVLDVPVSALQQKANWLTSAIESETRFGVGATFKSRRQHDVMDRDWGVTPVTRQHKDKAHSQLGTSGSGNHFVEFGTLTLDAPELGLEQGTYLALLSHSGSRGTGAEVARYYSEAARKRHQELPKELAHLAWLDLDSEAGQEYWAAMELMGAYAAANHELIHRHIVAHLGATVITHVENHHNFAWRERIDVDGKSEAVVVHRKGATPAGPGVLGVIPGSMATPGYVVRGKGEPASLQSASHGAGRRMSRTAAKQRYTWAEAKAFLHERGVHLISAGLDEVPMAYKDIEEVMQAQTELVNPIARFEPKLVKMAPAGERPED